MTHSLPLYFYTPQESQQKEIQALFDRLRPQLPEHLSPLLVDELPREAGALVLLLDSQGLSLGEAGKKAPKPVQVDFTAGKAAHRRQFGGGKSQLIAKAVGLHTGVKPRVLDATAGLGGDAFVLAGLGCSMLLLERHPVVAALLQDGLERGLLDPEAVEVVSRMPLVTGNAIDTMQQAVTEMAFAPQVIYLDPMFPSREKTAQVKKEMKLFHQLVGMDQDDDQLLEAAWALATHRVVVKRPRKAPAITGLRPTYVLEGKSSRYDIYTKRKLDAPDVKLDASGVGTLEE
jgi:16S rRNA (guanine1516-N2)-methyltransferase